MSKLLLHACCGPCSLEPIKLLKSRGQEFSIFYSNSNIAPKQEYVLRLQTIKNYCMQSNIEFFEDVYDNHLWVDEAKKVCFKKPERCRLCYAMRFERSAAFAVENGFTHLGTTLTISPYQMIDVVKQELERVCEKYGLESGFEDYSPFYYEAQKRAKSLELYRQKYCGCLQSKREAKKEEETRLKAKKDAATAREAMLDAKRKKRSDYQKKQQYKKEVLRKFKEAHEN